VVGNFAKVIFVSDVESALIGPSFFLIAPVKAEL
jgi:hypothetical protein